MKKIEIFNGQQFEAHEASGYFPCHKCYFKCESPLDAPIKCMAHEREDKTSVYFTQVNISGKTLASEK